MAGEMPVDGVAAAAGVDWGVVLLIAAFMTAKSSTGATV
jgi:hypothetical protein